MATLNEGLCLVDDIARELSFYDGGNYKQLNEQTIINRCKDLLEKVKTNIMAKDPDGIIRAEKLSSDDWRRISLLVGPLARCFTASSPPAAPTVKTRHASAVAVAALALLSSCNQQSKVIATSALENGVVDAFVSTLRNSLRSQVNDRVVKAMLYKLIESLWGFTLYATTQLQQDMVAKDVVNVCLDLVTSATVEIESKLNASKTLYNCLSSHGRVVTELRASKVAALNHLVQQLGSQVPSPEAAAHLALTGLSSGASKAISMPQMLPSIMSWIWFLPNYIVDHLIDSLAFTLNRVVVLVWPDGHPGIPLLEQGRDEPSAGPLHVAQLSLPNRSLQKTLQHLFRSIASGIADKRLVSILRGARLPSVTHDPAESEDLNVAEAEEEAGGTGLPARLVKVVREGRPDGNETRVALELLDELFACDANGGHPELADDALAAGLLASMTEMGVLHSLHTEAGIAGVSAYVRLTMKLIRRVPYTPGLGSRLHGSGVPASVAYVAFWPTSRVSLKLEALQTLYELVQLDTNMTEHVVAMNNFPVALTNTLLGGDPDTRKPAKKSGSSAAGKKKSGSGMGPSTAAAAAATSTAIASEISVTNRRDHRDQMQETAFNILTVVLDEARESDKVWETVVESSMLPRLVQHSCAFPMQPALLAELLLAIGITFKDHRDDIASVGPLQAACAPHILPLLIHEEPVVVAAAARVLRDILLDMVRYRSDSTDVAEGDEILKALVAAGPSIDTADVAAAKAAAAAAKAATVVAAVAVVKEGEPRPSPGKPEPMTRQEEGGSPNGGPVVPPGASGTPTDESQRASAQGDGMMEVDTGPISGAAPLTVVAGFTRAAGAGDCSGLGVGGAGASVSVPGVAETAAAAAAAGDAGREPDTLDLVDVTAQGLGLMCAAIQICVATVLQRPRGVTPASASSGLRAAAVAAMPVSSTALSPTKGGGPPVRTAVLTAPPTVMEGPAYEALEALLLSCRLLGEACLHMPPHGIVRKHLARAFAYARPAAEELAVALQALPDLEHGHLQLQSDCHALLDVLGKIPVLNVALLPKPKVVEEEDANLISAPAPLPGPKKGRPPGTGKRASQVNLTADGTLQPIQGPTKRQRTASAAALAAAEDTAPRTRASAIATNGELTAIGNMRVSVPRGAAAVAAAVAGNGSALPAEVYSTAGTLLQHGKAGGRTSGGGADAAGGTPLAQYGSDGPRIDAGRGGVPSSSAAAAVQGARAASGLGIPLPAMPRATRTPQPEHVTGQEQTAAQQSAPLSESPSISLENQDNQAGPSLATRTAAVAGGADAKVKQESAVAGPVPSTLNGVPDAGGAKGRVNAAEFRARYLEMKTQNARMVQELENLRLAKEESESLQRKTAAMLSSRNELLARALQELGDKHQEVEDLKKQLENVTAELQGAQQTVNSLQSVMTGSAAELEQLRAENADLKAELANLADLE
ncbi:hypothetical protein Vretimale_18363 [Volvox reticuliferus]|uniref:Uncharacterized protein n=1 Tax=Volvox reticuliferus TaxID=1737510 RepID=A0A8J4GUR0_9CHLO|nr:hypothetical protein Vretifemale_8807 [Volvox reticuliferus]GIM15596.1 hypothetical protein Vretimale_18363 [Volvox reticuliferus]